MKNQELIDLLKDVEYLFRHDGWQHLKPEAVAEVLVMARHAIELQPSSQVRLSDPATSRKAAQSAAIRSGSQRHLLLQQYAHSKGLTDEQAGRMAGLLRPGVCYWKRCSELREFGYIEHLGFSREASTGEQQMVCGITTAGVKILEGSEMARSR